MSTIEIATDQEVWKEHAEKLPSNTIHRVTHIGILCAAACVFTLKMLVIFSQQLQQGLSLMGGGLSSSTTNIVMTILMLLCYLGIPFWAVVAGFVTRSADVGWKNTLYNIYYGLLASFAIFGCWFFPDMIINWEDLRRLFPYPKIWWGWPAGFRHLMGHDWWENRSSDLSSQVVGCVVSGIAALLLAMTLVSVLPGKLRFYRFRYLPKSPSMVFLVFSFLPGAVLALTCFFVSDLDVPAREFMVLNLLGVLLVPAIAGIYSRRYEMAVMCCMNYLGIGGAAMWLVVIYRI